MPQLDQVVFAINEGADQLNVQPKQLVDVIEKIVPEFLPRGVKELFAAYCEKVRGEL